MATTITTTTTLTALTTIAKIFKVFESTNNEDRQRKKKWFFKNGKEMSQHVCLIVNFLNFFVFILKSNEIFLKRQAACIDF